MNGRRLRSMLGSQPPRPRPRPPSSKGAVFFIAGMIVGALIGSMCRYRQSGSSIGPSASSAERRRGKHVPSSSHTPSLLRSDDPDPDPDPNAPEPWPRIAWLMSFPNSGTTFTLDLVGNASLRYPASNYGERSAVVVVESGDDAPGRNSSSTSSVGGGEGEGEGEGTRTMMIPVLDGSTVGPFWYGHSSSSDPSSSLGDDVVRRPTVGESGYVLTKTHCGNRCVMCGPTRYMGTQHQFQRHCVETKHVDYDAVVKKSRIASASASAANTTTEVYFFKRHNKERPYYTYDPKVVRRAVHLVRDPFDNVVARFRYYQKHHPDKYTRDKVGFRRFCSDLNSRYADEEERSTLLEKSILDVIRHVPCHGAFVAYVMWHNYAFTTTRNMQLPTLVVHYEDYESRFDETLEGLMDFLELDVVGRRIEFVARDDYADYYTEGEIADVKVALKELAYLETWQNIERYF